MVAVAEAAAAVVRVAVVVLSNVHTFTTDI
jgi:hypothetical protein